MRSCSFSPVRNQHGAVLAIALVFMLLLTIIGVGAMQSSSLQERMAGNSRDTNTAFQAAEAAVREAEKYLQGASVGPFIGSAGTGLFRFCGEGVTGAGCTVPDWSNRASTGWVKRPGTLAGVSEQPEYIIQQMPPISDPSGSLIADKPSEAWDVYMITARGFGSSDATMVVLQTMYRRS